MKFVGKDGTYTILEESATDKKWADMKYQRILHNWHSILSRSITNNDIYIRKVNNDDLLCINDIQYLINVLDNGSTFEISMIEL